MISVICVYNDKKILEDWLLLTLRRQNIEYEEILIDNTQNTFTSAAEALNYGGEMARGDFLMFVHQDVRLETNDWLENAEAWLKKIEHFGVAGVAGKAVEGRNQRQRGRNIIQHGDPPEVSRWSNPISRPAEVQTVDELLFIVPRSIIDYHKFDETTCDGWHLYAVDFCLTVQRAGLKCYVLPLSVWHRSRGNVGTPVQAVLNFGIFPNEYYKTLKKVLTKYKKDYCWIYTTCGAWSTRQPLIFQRVGSLCYGCFYYLGRVIGLVLKVR